MFFKTKKEKIRLYLENKLDEHTTFDEILSEYINGDLKDRMDDLEIRKADFHVDWSDDYKCLEIQGEYNDYIIDIQIEEEEFLINCGQDEPDNPTFYPLESKDKFYSIVKSTLKKIDD